VSLACELQAVDWSQIYNATHLEKVYIFELSILSIFDRLAPLTVRHINRPRAPWITPAICGLIKLKSRSLRRYQRFRDSI